MDKFWRKFEETFDSYHDYQLVQYEIFNNLFKNVKNVKLIGGGLSLDFFIGQYNNDVEYCLCEDQNLEFRSENLKDAHKKYIEEFEYKGEFEFIQRRSDKPFSNHIFDLIIDSTHIPINPQDDIILPKIYIKNHYRKIHRWPDMLEIHKTIPMRFATYHSCVYSKQELKAEYDYFRHMSWEKNLIFEDIDVPVIYCGYRQLT